MVATLEVLTQRIARRDLPPVEMRRALRRGAGLTLADIAEAVGVTRQPVSWWERGRRTPRGPNLDAYGEVLRALGRENVHLETGRAP
jgi:transcriptional regulator with XRE-family HTH domain